MKRLKITKIFVLSVILVLSAIIGVDATSTNDEYCGLDLENLYTPNLPDINDEPGSRTTQPFYDPRIQNATTPLKDQGDLNTCTIFATNAIMESVVYKNTGLKYSYSEEAARIILSKNLVIRNNLDTYAGFYKYKCDEERNFETAIQYLTNMNTPIIRNNSTIWYAPNYSSNVPYNDEEREEDYWPVNMNTYANAYATDTKYIRNDQIKDAILQYGAVYKTFYAINGNYNEATGSYCTFYSEDNDQKINHSAAVVGWNDDYPKDNFNDNNRPANDGAWLIKNSMGQNGGAAGYHWVSYEDDSFNAEDAAVITKVDNVSKNELMLSYDFLPMTDEFECDVEIGTNSKYICNVYDVSELTDDYGSINKVMFYSGGLGDFYRIYIAPVNEDGALPNVNTLTNSLAYGSIDYEGYKTVEFDESYQLEDSVEKYAVIVKYITDKDYVSVYQESEKSKNKNAADGNFWYNIESYGESYIYENGAWIDVATGDSSANRYNFCIRPTLVRKTSIAQNSEITPSMVQNDNTDLSVDLSLNGNQLYCIKLDGEVLFEDVDFTRNGNTITFDESFMGDLSPSSCTNIVFEFTDGADCYLKIYPKSLSNVSISGKVAKGQTLTANALCNDGTPPPSNKVKYQWQSSSDGINWTNIEGANATTYTLSSNEFLKYIRCAVSVNGSNTILLPATIYSNSTATKVIIYGDVNLDGTVSTMDTTMLQMYLAQMVDLTQEQLIAADVNGDGTVSNFDTTEIQLYLAHMITSFPVET